MEILEDRTVPTVVAGPITNPANGHIYYLLSQSNWTTAEAQAVALGGHLATINNAAEDAWVFDTFSRTGQYGLWIGQNDAAREGSFVWSSGEPITYTNWSGSQPDNYQGKEDYGMIFVEGHGWPSRTWNDFWDTNIEDFIPPPDVRGVMQGVVEIAVKPDIDIQSAQLVSGNTVQYTYATTGNPGPFQVGLYRSADGASYNAADQIGGLQTITPSPANPPQSAGAFTLPVDFQPDAAKPYLLVAADPDNAIAESNEDNNTVFTFLSDVAVLSARFQSGDTLQFTYQSTGSPGAFLVAVFRSSDPVFDPQDPLIVSSVRIFNSQAADQIRTDSDSLRS